MSKLIDPLTVRADVEQRLLEWRSLIQDRKTHALRLLKQLIVGRLELIPNMEERVLRLLGHRHAAAGHRWSRTTERGVPTGTRGR